ncbi:hypothetical protein [Cyanobium sp. ATX-6F1]|uniref:hypothetical protein n=1 Tax=Cyanobium sp. ATX-6F1 TaxID=3137388 RepID=UPI0039BEC568
MKALLPTLLGAGCVAGLVLGVSSPAEAITYWIRSGTYTYSGSTGAPTFSGYFDWDGSALSGGSLTVSGSNPLGGTSTTYSNVAYNASNPVSPNSFLTFFNNPGQTPSGITFQLTGVLSAAPNGTSHGNIFPYPDKYLLL